MPRGSPNLSGQARSENDSSGGNDLIPARRTRETEVKIRIDNASALCARLKQLGFRRIHPRALEDNVLFDTPDRALRRARCLVRIREYGSRWTVTYKGTPDPDRFFKSRIELESQVDNPEAMRAILFKLGMHPVFRYQKYRAEFALGEQRRSRKPTLEVALLEIALDETPIGDYIELEGSRRSIDRGARALGYSRSDYITASYGALYLEDCVRRKKPPTDMVFRKSPRRNLRKKRAGG